jgi:drug/metabolite transporter (DMT)-like permease
MKVALFIAVLSISFAATFFKLGAPTHPVVMAGLRLAIAALCLSPFVVRGWRKKTLTRKHFGLALVAGLFYGLHFGAWVSSLTLTTVAASTTLVTTTPVLLAIVGLVRGVDKPDRVIWLSIAIALVGLLLIGSEDAHSGVDSLVGDVLAFLGACAMAGYMLTARSAGEQLDVWAFGGVACAVGAVLLLSSAAVAGISLAPANKTALMYIVLAAVIPQLVGHSLLTLALRKVKPSTVAMAVLGEPVGATAIAWLWMGETVSLLVALGCLVTLSAVALAVRTARTPG